MRAKGHLGRRIAIAALGLTLVLAGWGEATEPQPAVGHAAPDFTAPDVDGRSVRLADYRGKRAVLLNFWATWCVPCRLEMPTMEQAYQDYKARGLEILAVSIDVGHRLVVPATVALFMDELKLTFPALLDPDMEVARRYRVFGIPMTFLIDREGIIRAREPGFRDWTTPESRGKLEELLGQRR
ncbi:MAG: TlpA family protein disulfide reductase [candidate division NC10 bacterium]|nr:TlpA family protein disulfide reductase [candidate division NC10 bacterium]